VTGRYSPKGLEQAPFHGCLKCEAQIEGEGFLPYGHWKIMNAKVLKQRTKALAAPISKLIDFLPKRTGWPWAGGANWRTARRAKSSADFISNM
jgi:hypothetical protein